MQAHLNGDCCRCRPMRLRALACACSLAGAMPSPGQTAGASHLQADCRLVQVAAVVVLLQQHGHLAGHGVGGGWGGGAKSAGSR